MTQEQKAKAYDEALERMKSWVRGEHPECFTEAQKAAEFIFPELKKSDDEKMMNQLHSWMKEFGGAEEYTENVYQWIKGLLEKQGEQRYLTGVDLGDPAGDKSCIFNYSNATIQQKDFAPFESGFLFKVKYAGKEYKVKKIIGDVFYGIEDEPNHIDYVLSNNCEVLSKQNSEWSEEDTIRLNQAIYVLHRQGYSDVENWLKNLNPQKINVK